VLAGRQPTRRTTASSSSYSRKTLQLIGPRRGHPGETHRTKLLRLFTVEFEDYRHKSSSRCTPALGPVSWRPSNGRNSKSGCATTTSRVDYQTYRGGVGQRPAGSGDVSVYVPAVVLLAVVTAMLELPEPLTEVGLNEPLARWAIR